MELWTQCSGLLESRLSSEDFNTWIKPLSAETTNNSLEIKAPNDFIYPKNLGNLHVNQKPTGKGPVLTCGWNQIPTYRAMEQFSKKKRDWQGTAKDLGEKFYEV